MVSESLNLVGNMVDAARSGPVRWGVMAAIAANKLLMVRKLVETAPDAALRSLELALSGPAGGQGALAAVRGLVEDETTARYVRNSVLAPIVPLCAARDTEQTSFPPRTLALLWTALKAPGPQAGRGGRGALQSVGPGAGPARGLQRTLQDRLQGPARPGRARLPGAGRDLRHRRAGLVPGAVAIVRAALPRLQEWVSKMSEERASSARLAYKDACAIRPDAGPLLFEMLAAHLPDDWRILRVISAVMERPNDKFWASSEVGVFGERVLADIEKNIDFIEAFDPPRARPRAARPRPPPTGSPSRSPSSSSR
jgi:hypothetical protein